MVNPGVTTARAAERAMLLLLHVPREARAALAALLALDDRLAQLFAAGREPALRQIRLAWWRDALVALDAAPPPAEPTLSALSQEILPRGVAGTALAAMAEGWEELLAVTDRPALERFAAETGATLFRALATVLGVQDDRVACAGQGWALARLASLSGDPTARVVAAGMASHLLSGVMAERWPRPLRPIAMLVALARSDLSGGAPNTPTRAALLWRVRLFGR